MRVAITGSSGLIGSALVPFLLESGHEVVRVVRRAALPGELTWNPEEGTIDLRALAGTDAVVHLAGAPLAAGWWTTSKKRRILESRTRGTELISASISSLDPPPAVMVSGSAVGYYGNAGSMPLTEDDRPGSGFLAEVARSWEAATKPAGAAGTRVVLVRTGVVLSAAGGMLARQLPLFKLGLGGRIGNGHQYVSWISLDDEVGAIAHLLSNPALAGPFNLTSPHPVTNAELTRVLASVLKRPALLTLPARVLEIALGAEMASQLLLGGQRVLPARLEAGGYQFIYPDLDAALRNAVGR
jgi:uncharacterized protein (TIGR01777 family)